MGGTLWLKSSSGPKSLPPAGVLLPAFETNRVSVCGGTTIERDSHRTGKRLADPIGSDRSFVHAACDPVIIWPRLPEVLLKKGKRLLSEVEPAFDPEPIHLRCRRRPNAVELLDRQFFDEGRPHLRWQSSYSERVIRRCSLVVQRLLI
jgi:hypothetical protein